jgi:hypothetical protein
MDKIWVFKVEVAQGVQYWGVAYEDKVEARAALAMVLDDGNIGEAKRIDNSENIEDGKCCHCLQLGTLRGNQPSFRTARTLARSSKRADVKIDPIVTLFDHKGFQMFMSRLYAT